MSTTATRILGLLAVAFGAAALGHGSGWSTAGALRAGQGFLGAVAWGGAAVGIGGALLGEGRRRREGRRREGERPRAPGLCSIQTVPRATSRISVRGLSGALNLAIFLRTGPIFWPLRWFIL